MAFLPSTPKLTTTLPKRRVEKNFRTDLMIPNYPSLSSSLDCPFSNSTIAGVLSERKVEGLNFDSRVYDLQR